MTPPAWLLVAAAVLALGAGWCANAEAALALVSATGVAERPEHQGRLSSVAADLPRYLSVLLLLRAICEVLAAVLVTAAFVHWLGDDWRAVLSALAVVIALRYALTGVRPQTGRVGPRTERTAARAAAFLFPLTRALGPLPRLLVACGNAMPPTRRGRPPKDQEGPVDRSELRGLVDYLERRTGIEPGERDMVRSVFELGDTIVREVMVPRTDMVFIESDKTVEQALSLALAQRLLPDPGGRREPGRRGRHRLPEGHRGLESRAPGRRGRREGRHGDAPGQLRARQQAGRRAAPPDAGAAQPHGHRDRRVRRDRRPGHHRGHPRGDRRRDHRRVRQRAAPGRVALRPTPPG